VVRVVDGDTLVVAIDGREEKVRLIGVDTPESVDPRRPVEYFGREASAFLSGLVEGKRVALAGGAGSQNRDRYGRLLRYVYLEDGTLVNAEIIRRGYGLAYTRFPFERMEEFRGYERQARAQGRGLWTEASAPGAAALSETTALSETAALSETTALSGAEPAPGGGAPPASAAFPEPAGSSGVVAPPGVVAPRGENRRVAALEQTVYVTRTGSRYHRPGCRYLSRSVIAMALKEAASRYGPCRSCRPPAPTSESGG
jgi:micrococcal nuclease